MASIKTELNRALKKVSSKKSYKDLGLYIKSADGERMPVEDDFGNEFTVVAVFLQIGVENPPSGKLKGGWFKSFIKEASDFDFRLDSVYVDQDGDLIFSFTGNYSE